MKAAVLYESPGTLHIEDVTIDDPAPHEVLVQVKATGLCHSDLHYLEASYPMDAATVLGHEASGVIQAVGGEVSGFNAGDHVISYPLGFCGHCKWCLSGRLTLCDQVPLRRPPGSPPRLRLSRDGSELLQYAGLSTFAEQMLVHENALVKIDDDIPFDRAALVGCAVPTGVGAVIRTAKVPPGATVAVVGCGGIGLNVVQGAVIAGAERIIGIDINDGKLALAKEFGATDVINNSNGDAVAQLADLLPGEGGVDYSFESVGTRSTYELAFELIHRGGTTTVIGVVYGKFELEMHDVLQERRIQGSTMGSINLRKDLPYLLNLYKAGRLNLDRLVSKQIPLEEINEGYAAISDGNIARSVVVFG
jgi:S-(hydroxymethyl)glutathione dehydrogenase / alcohol dehydrogenase